MDQARGGAAAAGDDPARWRSRPRLAVALRTAILLSPVAASIGAGLVTSRLLGEASLGVFVLVVGAVCVVTSLLTERVVRRFLPLEALLRMTMLFPERAPSRLAVLRLGRDRAEQRRMLASGVGAGDVAHVMLALITALGRHDKRTRGHSERVRMITELLADQLALPEADRDRLRWAALLHDVGKLEVPVSIITKPAPLDRPEWDQMRQHPVHGARLAGPFLDWLGEWAGGISHHHEHWDGGGYPAGLAGEQISRAGRIVGVVDAFETMTAARSYKKAAGTRAALTELTRCSGTQFDPAVVRQFLCIPVPKLWWATGPLGLLVQVPVIGSAQQSALQVTAGVGATAGSSVAAAGTAAVMGVGSALGVTPAVLPPAAADVVQQLVGGDPAADLGDEVDGAAPGAPGTGGPGVFGPPSTGWVPSPRSSSDPRPTGPSGPTGTRPPGAVPAPRTPAPGGPTPSARPAPPGDATPDAPTASPPPTVADPDAPAPAPEATKAPRPSTTRPGAPGAPPSATTRPQATSRPTAPAPSTPPAPSTRPTPGTPGTTPPSPATAAGQPPAGPTPTG